MRSMKSRSIITPSGYHFDPKTLCHWCFDDCPEEEIYACWHYEYLRDCPSAVRKILNWRQKHPESQKDLIKYIDADPYERLFLQWPYERFVQQWPMTPYLEINPKVRRFHLIIKSVIGKFLHDGLAEHRRMKEVVAVFPIRDWALSDPKLISEFKKFLKLMRPKDTVFETRGRRQKCRTVRWELKALGAYRLARVMSQNEVINYTEGCDRGLYKNQPELSKVLRQTEKYITFLDQNLQVG
jgi:hypothetical protein